MDAGTPIPLGVSLFAFAQSTASSYDTVSQAGAIATTYADFSHTMAWGGITSVTDENGEPILGWSVSSDTGFDYSQAAVPEPSTFVLLGFTGASLAVAIAQESMADSLKSGDSGSLETSENREHLYVVNGASNPRPQHLLPPPSYLKHIAPLVIECVSPSRASYIWGWHTVMENHRMVSTNYSSRNWSWIAAALATLLTPELSAANGYAVHNLVSDQLGVADQTDSDLLNAWGIAFLPGSPNWVADNHSGKATLYDGLGNKQAARCHYSRTRRIR